MLVDMFQTAFICSFVLVLMLYTAEQWFYYIGDFDRGYRMEQVIWCSYYLCVGLGVGMLLAILYSAFYL